MSSFKEFISYLRGFIDISLSYEDFLFLLVSYFAIKTVWVFLREGLKGLTGAKTLIDFTRRILNKALASFNLGNFESTVNSITKEFDKGFFNKQLHIKDVSADDLSDPASLLGESDSMNVYVDRSDRPGYAKLKAVEDYVEKLFPSIDHTDVESFVNSNIIYIVGTIVDQVEDADIVREYNDKYDLDESEINYMEKASDLDYNDYYYPIFLDAVRDTTNHIATSAYSKDFSLEMVDFFDFIYTVSESKKIDDPDLDYIEEYFRYSIVLVSTEETLEQDGIQAYLSKIGSLMENNARKIYVRGSGREDKTNVRYITTQIKRQDNVEISSEKDLKKRHSKPPRYITAINNEESKSSFDIKKYNLESIIEDAVPEVKEGKIHIEGIAINEGRAMVSVESLEPDLNPALTCIGENGKRAKYIREEFGLYVINFIDKNSNYSILKSLPLDEENVKKIQINSGENEVNIRIRDGSIPEGFCERFEKATNYIINTENGTPKW